jgi:hypothetical protein
MESRGSPEQRKVAVWEGITVKELSQNLQVKPGPVMKRLMDRGIFVASDQPLDLRLLRRIRIRAVRLRACFQRTCARIGRTRPPV